MIWNMIRQYLYILLLIVIVFILAGCSNVKMACTMSDTKYYDKKENTPTISDKAKDCVNNPTVIVFKEF